MDFFERGRKALAQGGIYAHWVQLYDMTPDELRLVVRSFVSVFPESVLATTIPGVDILLIGFTGEPAIDMSRIREGMARDSIRADLSRSPVGIETPEDLVEHIRVRPEALHRLGGHGALNTFDRPLLSYSAPRSRFRDTSRENMALIDRHAEGVAPLVENMHSATLTSAPRKVP